MPLVLPDNLMVSVSGVRGRVGDPLTPELMAGIAAAFGAFLRREGAEGPVLVGRDSRTSGPMFSRAVVAGLQSVGCPVVELGVVPTPTLLLAVEDAKAAGGLCVTASHNPAEWNALKLVSGEGMFLDAEMAGRFQRFLAEEDPPRVAWDHIPEATHDAEAWPRHRERILALPHLDVDAIRARKLRVAVDCVRGAGGPVMVDLLQRLGCELHTMGMEPDGRFPRDPEPTAANLAGLGALVRDSGAEIGLAIDPDADRLSLVDDGGTPLGEDLTLALASAVVLRRTPGPVVTNLSTSQVVEDVARSFDVPVVRAPVGEVNVARRMQAEAAVVGGEGNGGVILPALHHTRDAPLAAALVLQYLVDEGMSISEAARRLPVYAIVKEKVGFPREALTHAYDALEHDLGPATKDTSDGLRLAWPERGAWLHVRPSGTEPVVRLIAEARTDAEAKALVKRAARILEGVA
ncbi:MAG: phosphoglucosamine mutase [Gemmatimonadota bacterium]|nr:phosphoglucosamine mutase [Gemmatimonadota bacterium]MDH5758141.1 phosphoglucosamine mutase [Gemmatimonadota bacterium]